jgi:hypothetical protein
MVCVRQCRCELHTQEHIVAWVSLYSKSPRGLAAHPSPRSGMCIYIWACVSTIHLRALGGPTLPRFMYLGTYLDIQVCRRLFFFCIYSYQYIHIYIYMYGSVYVLGCLALPPMKPPLQTWLCVYVCTSGALYLYMGWPSRLFARVLEELWAREVLFG